MKIAILGTGVVGQTIGTKLVPPTLSLCSTDSLGEQIQRAFPGVL